MITVHLPLRLSILATTILLNGCHEKNDQAALQTWLEHTQRQATNITAPLSQQEKTAFTAYRYDATDTIDPFSHHKLLAPVTPHTSHTQPDSMRNHEALEAYPLESIHMVGTLSKPGLHWVLLRVGSHIYHAKVGNYLGKNFGIIKNISPTAIDITECLRTPHGEWIAHAVKLEMQETTK